jgi:hypothetical protein
VCLGATKTQQNANKHHGAAPCAFTLQHVVSHNEANNIISACGGGRMTALVHN